MKQSEVEKLTIPSSYTLDNILVYIATREFLINNLEELKSNNEENINKLVNNYRLHLMNIFKYSFTKIDLSYKGGLVKGYVQHTTGNPLSFELTVE